MQLQAYSSGWTGFSKEADDDALRRDLRRFALVRGQALTRLWQHALSTLNIRYLDPDVHLVIEVEHHSVFDDQTHITFRLFNVRDTSNLEAKIRQPGGLILPCNPGYWPGLEVAQIYLTAVWTVFLMHEAMELVTYRNPPWYIGYKVLDNGKFEMRYADKPVVSAHDTEGVSNRAIARMWDVAATCDWVLGPGKGTIAVSRAKPVATRELDAEIAYLSGDVPREE
jgi:hypothetical protein